MTVSISVIVPTRNRREPLIRLLYALAQQDVGATAFDVVVVLDGCTDGTAAMLAAFDGGLRLHWQPQLHRGAAAARNAGAAVAAGEVLLFLDDDVVPEPDLVARHAARHDGSPRAVVGECPFVLPSRPGPGDLKSWAWWEEFNATRRSNPVRSYRDLCAGNASIDRATFERLGGFDDAFNAYGWEDWELGIRLLQAGVRIEVEPGAIAWHHRRHPLGEILQHARHEGRGDVSIARRYPELISGLRLVGDAESSDRSVGRAMQSPRRGWTEVTARRWWVGLLTTIGLHRRFHAVTRARALAYWVGVAEAAGSETALRELRRSAAPPVRLAVDLDDGLPEWLPVPAQTPCQVEVSLRGRLIGTVPIPAFRLRSRPELARHIARHLEPELLTTAERGLV